MRLVQNPRLEMEERADSQDDENTAFCYNEEERLQSITAEKKACFIARTGARASLSCRFLSLRAADVVIGLQTPPRAFGH
jgi:hypothetical protein